MTFDFLVRILAPAVIIVTGAVLAARLVHKVLPFLNRFFIPPAITGGLILLCCGTSGLGWIPVQIGQFITRWPTVLVTLLFAGIVLGEKRALTEPGIAREVLRQGLFVWVVATSQICVGFAAALFLLPAAAPLLLGHTIEISWAGGPGSAAAFKNIAEKLGDAASGDLAVAGATAGLIWGTLSGVAALSFLPRPVAQGDDSLDAKAVQAPRSPVWTYPVAAVNLLIAAGLAWVWLKFASFAVSAVSIHAGRFVDELPLFFTALLVAYVMRPLLRRAPSSDETAGAAATLTSIILEILVVSAIASVRPSVLLQNASVFLILMAAAAVWSGVQLFVFSRLLLPRHVWTELALLNYGMATGTTALGLMLLRAYKSRMEMPAATVYGLAAPLSAPFIGGGAVSLLLPELTARGWGLWIFLGSGFICFILFIAGLLLARMERRSLST